MSILSVYEIDAIALFKLIVYLQSSTPIVFTIHHILILVILQ